MAASSLGNLRKITLDELNKQLRSGKEQIVDCEIIEEVWIGNANIKDVCFVNCKFTKLSILKKLDKLTIQNCDFYEVKIHSDIENLNLIDIESNTAKILGNKISIKNLSIDECKQIQDIRLGYTGSVSINALHCYCSRIENFVYFGVADNVLINQENYIKSLTLVGKFGNVKIENHKLTDEEIQPNFIENFSYSNALSEGKLKVENSEVSYFTISGSYIEISKLKCEKLIFKIDLDTNAVVKIKECDFLNKIYFLSSVVSSLEIFNSNFSSTRFITGQSSIEKIRWQLVDWSEKLENYSDQNLNKFFRGETLRNLKLNALNQQDTINYIKFYSLEMQAYQQQIKTKKWYSEDRMLLCLNRISNKHRLSWRRGVLFSLAVGALFFFPNLFLLEDSYWEFGWNSWSDFWVVCSTTLRLFSQALYAAHSFDYLNEFKPNGIAFFIDFIGRIFLAYGYYQTIVAFRKFSRK